MEQLWRYTPAAALSPPIFTPSLLSSRLSRLPFGAGKCEGSQIPTKSSYEVGWGNSARFLKPCRLFSSGAAIASCCRSVGLGTPGRRESRRWHGFWLWVAPVLLQGRSCYGKEAISARLSSGKQSFLRRDSGSRQNNNIV